MKFEKLCHAFYGMPELPEEMFSFLTDFCISVLVSPERPDADCLWDGNRGLIGGMKMTKRERFLKAMKNEKTDALVWAPNFDYWLQVNRAEATLPRKYEGMSRNDIVRSMGAYIWNRAPGLKTCYDPRIREKWTQAGDNMVREIETPIGSLREVHARSEGEHRSRALQEHFLKEPGDIRILKYVIEGTDYEADYGPVINALQETGEDGIVLHQYFCVPFIQFAKTDAGYLNGYYMWMDYREQVDELLEAYFRNYLKGFGILSEGPADVIASGDNMDGTMISPPLFKEYAMPFYQEVKKITSGHGKIFEAHWCGRTQNLLGMVPDCGLDVVEAIVPEPMADIKLSEALELLRGKVVLQGGIPAVLVCSECYSDEEFDSYVQNVICPLKGRRGFILGMSDNVPPNADFKRVERISALIR